MLLFKLHISGMGLLLFDLSLLLDGRKGALHMFFMGRRLTLQSLGKRWFRFHYLLLLYILN